MSLWGDAGRKTAFDGNVLFRVKGFQKDCVAEYADSGTKTKKFDIVVLFNSVSQGRGAKGRLINNQTVFGVGKKLRTDFPTFSAFNTVLYRQLFSF